MEAIINLINRFLYSQPARDYYTKFSITIFATFLVYIYFKRFGLSEKFKSILKKLEFYTKDFKFTKIKAKYYIFVAVFVYLFLWQFFRHYRFATFGLDFGLFSQSLWYNSQFKLPRSSIRGFENLWGDHFTPFMAFLVPFSWILTPQIVVLSLQPIAIAFGAAYVYDWFTEKFEKKVALLVSFAYFSFFGHQAALVFDFHPIVLFSPLLLIILKNLFYKKSPNYQHVILATVLGLSLQEDVSIIIAYIFLVYVSKNLFLLIINSWFKTKRQKSVANFKGTLLFFFISLICIGYYLFVTRYVIEPNSSSDHTYFNYPALGSSFGDTLSNLSSSPLSTFSNIFNDILNFDYEQSSIWELIYSSGFLLLFSPISIILLVLPMLVKYLNPGYFIASNTFHYISYHFGFVVLAFAHVFNYIKLAYGKRVFNFVLVFIAITTIVSAYIDRNPYSTSFRTFFVKKEELELHKELKNIPKNKSIVASNPIVPHVSNRENVEVMCHNDRKTLPSMEITDYIIIYRHENGISNFPCSPEYEEYMSTREDYITVFENKIGLIRTLK